MDVSWIVCLSILYASMLVAAQDVSENATATTEASTTTDAITLKPQRNCTTARGASGTCVQRILCVYGTTAIDFTLYGPSWYMRTCLPDEVCCPSDFILDSTKPSTGGISEAFTSNTTIEADQDY